MDIPPRRIVIIGGVAAGMSTATRLRRLDERAEIIVLERSGYVSFANCGLAYHVGGVISDRADLLLQTPQGLARRFRLDVRVHSEVTSIDTSAHTVTVGGRETLHYDELVIATGAAPVVPSIPGAERMLVLRSIEDTDRLSAAVDGLPSGSRVVVVGAGYIGVELAENLTIQGFEVTLVQRGAHVLGSLDSEMASSVDAHLVRSGVDVRLGVTLTHVESDRVRLDDGSVIHSSLVISATGVRPDSRIAVDAGIRTGERGGIRVDEHHRTSAPHVWAVGDVAEKVSALDASDTLIMLAGPANRDGRYLADTLAGNPVVSHPTLGTAIVEVFGMTVASVGATERSLRADGRALRVIHTHPASHAGYYPGAEPMALKLIVDAETDAILGAQATGGTGVDKRIDVIATAMTARLTASTLADLELAYAPQFGSAKDPVNMLGYIARNLRDGQESQVQWHELEREIDEGAIVVDVRSAEEYDAGSIPGALNVPLDDLRGRVRELGSNRVVVHCEVGQRGHTAASLLRQLSIDAVNLDGGYRTWKAAQSSRHPELMGAL